MAKLKILQYLAGLFDYELVQKKHRQLVYIHEYESGYEEYKKEQVFHNKRKLDSVWADETTLIAIGDYLSSNTKKKKLSGICHGARNGFEVKWFRDKLKADVIGTDISETATRFPDMVVWDFQDENPDWKNKFDFVYTNSLDQAMDPAKALEAWAGQINKNGYIFIEHTMAHSAAGASSMDPFGAHPMCMPYLFFTWGRDKYQLCDILNIDEKKNEKIEAWIFVLKKS